MSESELLWDVDKIRNITLLDRVMKVITFSIIGPHNEAGKALKARINAHLSSDDENETHLLELVEAVDRDFLPDYRCIHTLLVSERNSECARRKGQLLITDCECQFCKSVNETWIAGDVVSETLLPAVDSGLSQDITAEIEYTEVSDDSVESESETADTGVEEIAESSEEYEPDLFQSEEE